MEYESRQRLIARLDECLLEHAVAITKRDGGVQIGDVYDLQDLAETHYYLKTGHELTPAEVEALLRFKDPLDVARWFREDNSHEHRFPICELLIEIRADERFERIAEAGAKASIRERLQDATREAGKRPAPESKPIDKDTR